MDKLRVINGTIIGVESMFDCMALHSWGYPNVIAMMGDGMSKSQANIISSRCNTYISLHDNDAGGLVAYEKSVKELGKNVMVLRPSYYPSRGKDPLDWGEIETLKVIRSCYEVKGTIPRFDDM